VNYQKFFILLTGSLAIGHCRLQTLRCRWRYALAKKIKRVLARSKKQPAPKKDSRGQTTPEPKDIPPEVKCNYPGWEAYLLQYPMVHSLQREDFPDHGVSFVYLAHFYRTKNTADESSLAQKEFEELFLKIGYEYDYSGNFESRWFEGIGVKID
jgi:hypothetical protein